MTLVREELEAALAGELERLIGVIEPAICGDLVVLFDLARSRVVLEAWQTRNLRLLEDLLPTYTGATRDRTHVREPRPLLRNALGSAVTTSLRSSSVCSSLRYEQTSSSESSDPVGVLYAHFLSLLPDPARRHPTPSDRLRKKLLKALAERPLSVCLDAVSGFAVRGGGAFEGKGIEAVFTTWRGTGSLAERIDYFASLTANPAVEGVPIEITNRPGVADRIHDVRLEIRAALDSPENKTYRRRAADSEKWLATQGLRVELRDTIYAKTLRHGFTILSGPSSTVFTDDE